MGLVQTPIRFKGFTVGKIDNIALATPDAPQMGGVSKVLRDSTNNLEKFV